MNEAPKQEETAEQEGDRGEAAMKAAEERYAKMPLSELVDMAEGMDATLRANASKEQPMRDERRDILHLVSYIKSRHRAERQAFEMKLIKDGMTHLNGLPDWPWWRIGDVRMMDGVPWKIQQVTRHGVLLKPMIPQVLRSECRPGKDGTKGEFSPEEACQ